MMRRFFCTPVADPRTPARIPAARVMLLAAALALAYACGRESPVAPTPAVSTAPDAPAAPAPDPDPAPGDADPDPPAPEPPPLDPPPPPPAPAAVIAGAGDIARCGVDGARQTAALLDAIDGIVFTAGDHAYSNGTREEFLECYDPHWGRHRARTRPSPGNHDYRMPDAAGYFEYFGPNAGPPGRGYYSFAAGAWLVVSLNSNVGAGPGSAQLEWLRAELQSRGTRCVAAIWHHPLASSGPRGPDPHMRDVWRVLMEFGADVVVAGHDHLYERFTPLDADGLPSGNGIRQFVVGTGGAELYEVGPLRPGSEAAGAVWGVLKLTLRSASYDWEFVPVPGSSFRDQGSAACR